MTHNDYKWFNLIKPEPKIVEESLNEFRELYSPILKEKFEDVIKIQGSTVEID